MLLALEGVRVLEVGSNLAAHFVGRQLAELGAEVLKVEPPGGDPSRRSGPFVRDVPHQDGSALFLHLNVGKRGVTLNQSTPTGREVLGRLAAGSDIVLWGDDIERGRAAAEAMQPGRTAAWLLISPYGASGPKAGWNARALTIYHAGGEGYLLPGGRSWEMYQDRAPLKGAEHLGEYSAGQSMTAAAMIGLMLGDPSTGPVLIDASIQEALLQLVRAEYEEYMGEGTIQSRGTRSTGLAGQLPAEDGWVQIMPTAQQPWDLLVDWMGNPEWAAPYATMEARAAARSLQDQEARDAKQHIGDWTAQMPKRQLYHEGNAQRIPVGAIFTIAEQLDDPQLSARGFFVEIDHPYAGALKYPTMAFQFRTIDGKEPQRIPAPLLGQHNVEVFEGELGLPRREVIALYEAGII